jgi:hypothetical protein
MFEFGSRYPLHRFSRLTHPFALSIDDVQDCRQHFHLLARFASVLLILDDLRR